MSHKVGKNSSIAGVFTAYLAIKNIAYINSHSSMSNENLLKTTVNLPSRLLRLQTH